MELKAVYLTESDWRDRANVLSLSRSRPSRASQTDTGTCGARGAEAPGQRTAASRLLRRVSPLFYFVSIAGTIGSPTAVSLPM